jgi:hypothetical protein
LSSGGITMAAAAESWFPANRRHKGRASTSMRCARC